MSAVSDGVEAQGIRVRPFADLHRLREVLVVVDARRESLPPDVQDSIAASHGRSPARYGAAHSTLPPTQADRIKQVYRSTVESQGRTVGVLSYSGPPDFSDAAKALRAAGSNPLTDPEEAE